MGFREYRIGSIMFGVALATSMVVTVYMPGLDISNTVATATALEKQLTYGKVAGFDYGDPFLHGDDKPIKVILKKDPKTGAAMDDTVAYVFKPGTSLPSGLVHDHINGAAIQDLSVRLGKTDQVSVESGGVYLVEKSVKNGVETPYIELASVTRGWTVDATLKAADQEILAGAGKVMFIREGCWWCHTLLPEQTHDWQSFGRPPMLGDFNGESPTTFGSDRKAPDLLHVGSRNSSKEWMMMHFFNPRLVQPHSIMPRYDYLWGGVDKQGNKIDLAKWDEEFDAYRVGDRVYPPEVPDYADNSEIRYLIDYILDLK